MYRGRNGTVARLALCAGVGLALSGCVQATRHSNAMIFGTNTSLAVRVGTDVATVPGITIGYNRQEAVILPLLANTAETHAEGMDGTPLNRLVPCPAPETILGPTQTLACQFAAVRGDARDAYSTLASFGANINAGEGTNPQAQVGLAQYFATGMAAQLLAATGGASVVNVSSRPPNDDGAAAAAGLFGTPQQLAAARTRVATYQSQMQLLSGLIASAVDPAQSRTKLARFETAIGADHGLSQICNTLDQSHCAAKLDELGDIFLDEYSASGGPQKFTDALAGWNAP